jgi:hypothetical protein
MEVTLFPYIPHFLYDLNFQHEMYHISAESQGIVMVLDQTVMSVKEGVGQGEVLAVEAVEAEVVVVAMTIAAKGNLIANQDLIKRK